MSRQLDLVRKQAAELHIQNKSNSINHFVNEQIRDAVTALEGEMPSDLVISSEGRINQYEDGTREFLWKGKVVLIVGIRETKEGDVEVFADHNYGEYFSTNLEEFNAMPHSDEENNDE